MSLQTKSIKAGIALAGPIYSALPFEGVSDPIFIIGCGRSGTTIFGRALFKHKSITYLNEPRYLWFSAYPETDIWTPKANSRQGKLWLTESDVDRSKSLKLRRLFRLATSISQRPILIEKWPVNSFRLRFIKKIFPNARFIHIYRNGLEVAKSIEKKAQKGAWYGANSYKWNKLVEYAINNEDTKNLPAICTTYFDKGLLEWRLSTEAIVDFLSFLPKNAFCELNYNSLLERPVQTISKVLDFIGVDDDRQVRNFVSNTVVRKSSKLNYNNMTEKTEAIGGKLLAMSIDGKEGLIKLKKASSFIEPIDKREFGVGSS